MADLVALTEQAEQSTALRRRVSGYDPRTFGARCDDCPLLTRREGGPVPPEIYSGSKAIIVGEAPGSDEVTGMRPMIGKSGTEATQALLAVGLKRDAVSWTNALLCRPPNNDLSTLLYKVQKESKAREKRGEKPLESPLACCQPRLMREVAQFANVITMGKTALTAVTGETKSIMEIRGTPVDGYIDPNTARFVDHQVFTAGGQVSPPLHVFPTIHPAFVLRARRWTKVFRSDLGRASRWFANGLVWAPYVPEVYLPTAPELFKFLHSGAPFYAYDVETDAREPLTAKLRCIGVATTEGGMVVPLRSIQGGYAFYPSQQHEEILDVLRDFFADDRIVKAGHNAGYYDRIVIEENLGVTPRPLVDTIMLHRAVDSELPHNLGFVGTIYTDVTKAWKAGNVATSAKTDQELHEYNLTDCVVTARCVAPLIKAIDLRSQRRCVTVDHKIQSFCVGLHRTGLFIDQKARQAHDVRLHTEAALERQACRDVVGLPDLNPGSVDQIKDLLFVKHGLEPERLTALGEPSTDDETLRGLAVNQNTPKTIREFLGHLRKFRRAVKLRGTYITRMAPANALMGPDDLALNADDPEEARALGEYGLVIDPSGKRSGRMGKLKEQKRGLVMGDGRVHPHWNAHVAVTGRLSSSEPNAQNWPYKIRNMVVPEPGRILVGADMDQIELRMCSALAGAARYLEVFKKGGDPHAITSELLYGATFVHGSEATRKRLRDFAKRFTYAVLYNASIETVHETITSAENEAGELLFPNVALRETRMLYDRWLGANPEFRKWWDDVVEEYRRQGYLEEPCLGRRRDFLDSTTDETDIPEIINYKAQATAASIVNLATVDLMEGPIPFDRWGPGTGMIAQVHDALYVECPIDQEQNVRGWLKECMTRTVPGLDVVFGAKPKSGYRWNEAA